MSFAKFNLIFNNGYVKILGIELIVGVWHLMYQVVFNPCGIDPKKKGKVETISLLNYRKVMTGPRRADDAEQFSRIVQFLIRSEAIALEQMVDDFLKKMFS